MIDAVTSAGSLHSLPTSTPARAWKLQPAQASVTVGVQDATPDPCSDPLFHMHASG